MGDQCCDILDYRGKFCEEEMTMCDGTNSYWCENSGSCEEIVQGENYTCNCFSGFTGEHCEHSGAPCGQIFCFHEAECLAEAEGDVCQCPPDWKGSTDCSLPTNTLTGRYIFPLSTLSICHNFPLILHLLNQYILGFLRCKVLGSTF